MTSSKPTAGVTIIVLTHDRPAALRALLDGLLKQELGGMELELLDYQLPNFYSAMALRNLSFATLRELFTKEEQRT